MADNGVMKTNALHSLQLRADAMQAAANVAVAIEETYTTPGPALGHGRLADIAALLTCALTLTGVCS